ncbi:MAG: ABC transporter substrate-binding protein [Bdellovibrionales bacterium]|nr:ABC transporter substrate-binding protein [Bdellovibrionales bacterium]
MTEESVEFLHAIDRSDLIAGVSVYAKRPEGVKKHPVISSFTHANLKKIKGLHPDLVIGFSDIQKDIAKELIAEGIDVYISNQRSLKEIFRYMWTLGHMVGEGEKTNHYLSLLEEKMEEAREFALGIKVRPRVYLEEWDEPQICGIRWFSELVTLCGGDDIFSSKSQSGVKANERFVTNLEVGEKNPDIILASWCGKKVDLSSITNRSELINCEAVLNNRVYELPPEVFLQPGPALFVDGIDQLMELFRPFYSK